MQPTMRLRFVTRPNGKNQPPGARMILQQQWREQVAFADQEEDGKWRHKWRDVPVEDET